MQKTGMQVGFGEKGQRAVGFLLIGNVKKTEEFKLVDKTFFAFFGSLCNGTEPTDILAEQGDDHVRFAVIGAFQNYGLGCLGVCHH